MLDVCVKRLQLFRITICGAQMYPIIRMTWQMWKHRNDRKLAFHEMHVSYHYCLPWDLDIFWELNNGRTLTLYDLGRIPLGYRIGLQSALRRRGWGLTVAGSSPRYRKRIRAFERIEMRSRGIGWDDKFVYVEQSMWKRDGTCAGHVLIRSAITGKDGIVAPIELVRELGQSTERLPLPDWVTNWVNADATRPWPPMLQN